jgi:HAD superfamily hydrolase (TIGR01549 family)
MKYWVFDLDGTLVDSFAPYFEALDHLFALVGKKFGPHLWEAALTDHLPVFFERHLGPEQVESALNELQSRSNSDAARISIFEGLEAMINHLISKNCRVAIWTNRDRESAEMILEATGLGKKTELLVSGTCVKNRKPDSEGLLRVIEHFGCEPAQVTMIGDHVYDVAAAKREGSRAVRASWHGYWNVPPCDVADLQFYDVKSFQSWVEAECSA